ncbi:MAG: hypothetical protein P8Y51_08240 [Campylobacterales bacterium]
MSETVHGLAHVGGQHLDLVEFECQPLRIQCARAEVPFQSGKDGIDLVQRLFPLMDDAFDHLTHLCDFRLLHEQLLQH